MAKDYASMNKEELEKELKRLKDNLEDLEETLSYYYSATQAHIPGGFVKQDEQELKDLREEIAQVEELLKSK
jgi:hypothetical protein